MSSFHQLLKINYNTDGFRCLFVLLYIEVQMRWCEQCWQLGCNQSAMVGDCIRTKIGIRGSQDLHLM
jgi:hypothetical protein